MVIWSTQTPDCACHLASGLAASLSLAPPHRPPCLAPATAGHPATDGHSDRSDGRLFLRPAPAGRATQPRNPSAGFSWSVRHQSQLAQTPGACWLPASFRTSGGLPFLASRRGHVATQAARISLLAYVRGCSAHYCGDGFGAGFALALSPVLCLIAWAPAAHGHLSGLVCLKIVLLRGTPGQEAEESSSARQAAYAKATTAREHSRENAKSTTNASMKNTRAPAAYLAPVL